MKFVSAYGKKVPCDLVFGDEESLVKGYFKDECDINNIIAKYDRTGLIDHVSNKSPIYADFSEVGDFHSCYNRIIAAEEAFFELPAVMRERFNNDAGEFIDFIHDDKNLEEMISLGLAERKADNSTQPSKDSSVEAKRPDSATT